MLVLTRKTDEAFYIGDNIKISIVEINGDKVKIAIDAPKEIKILRHELRELEKANIEAASVKLADINVLKGLIK